MTWDLGVEFVKIFGLPITILGLIIWAFMTDKVMTIGTHNKFIALYEDRIREAKDGESEMWGLVKPSIHITDAALDKAESAARKR